MNEAAQRAFDDGYQAFKDGVHLNDNPYFSYQFRIREEMAWTDGWNARAKEKAE